LLTGRIEVDECYIGGLEEGLLGRLNLKKALVVVAAQEDGPRIGRIRMRQIVDASAESLVPFVQDSVAPGSVVHTDGWLGYLPLEGTPSASIDGDPRVEASSFFASRSKLWPSILSPITESFTHAQENPNHNP
jgi:hypothetical protein